MDYTPFALDLETLPGAVPVRRAVVSGDELRSVCTAVHESGGLLHALWGCDERDRKGGYTLRVALQDAAGLLLLELPVHTAQPCFPTLTDIFPAAERMQRAVHDLLGLRAQEGDSRSWLRHASWPADCFPLRRDYDDRGIRATHNESYRFVRVTGDGVHEIAVGPVHAGTIEPGHFRFSVVGEKILRLEERLGYAHKGIEKRFETQPLMQGQRLAARVSGDSAVAFSWAYCASLESITETVCPARALVLRALALEQERLANHLGDLGALGNDAGFAFGLTQFSKLKEDLLRTNIIAFGARYLLDYVIPGGVAVDLTADARYLLLDLYDALEPSVN